MNNINKSLSINETYIIDSIEGSDILSACTAIYSNSIISCSGNTAILLQNGVISFNGNILAPVISGGTYYGDGSNLTGISTQDTFVTGGTYSNGSAVFTNNTGGTFSVTGFTTGTTASQNLQQVTDGVGNNITTNDIIVTGATGTDILISSQFDSSQITVIDGTASIVLAAQNGSGTSESLIQLASDAGFALIYPTGAQFIETGGGAVNIFPDRLELSSVANPIIRLTTLSGDTSIKTDLLTTINLEQQLPDKSGTFAMLDDIGDYLPLSGGTVSGATNFTSGITATTISATTYQNLPTDVFVTGATYTAGTAVFTNNTGGTFNVSGFNDVFVRNETNASVTDTITINQSIFNPSNLTVLNTSIFIIDTNADYYVLGDLINNGSIIINGTLKVGGQIFNSGTITGSGTLE
jgi:hypothetical protein